MFVPDIKWKPNLISLYFALITRLMYTFKSEQIDWCHFYTLIFSFLSKKKKNLKAAHNPRDWERVKLPSILHSTFAKDHFHHLYNTLGEEPKWLNNLHLLRAKQSRLVVLVHHSSSSTASLHRWYSFHYYLHSTHLLSGHLLCDFQEKMEEEETQLEEVAVFPPKFSIWWLLPAITIVCGVVHFQGWFLSCACCGFRF